MKVRSRLHEELVTAIAASAGAIAMAAKISATAGWLYKVVKSGEWTKAELDGVTLKYDKRSGGIYGMSDWGKAKSFLDRKYVRPMTSAKAPKDKKGKIRVSKGLQPLEKVDWWKSGMSFQRVPVFFFLTSKGRRRLENERNWFTYPW